MFATSFSSTTPGLADRLALILAGLRAVVAAKMARDRALVPLLTLLWSRLGRAADRFARVLRADPPTRAAPARAARPSGPPDRLPRGVAWLLRLVPEAAVYGTQLRALLAEPEMAALLAARPRAARIVRPLCRMLAVATPSPAVRRQTIRTAEPPPADAEPASVQGGLTLTTTPPIFARP